MRLLRSSERPEPTILSPAGSRSAGPTGRRAEGVREPGGHAAGVIGRAGWQNFNIAFRHGEQRTYRFEGARVELREEGVTIAAERPLLLLDPRTWQTETERFFQVFYRNPGPRATGALPERLHLLDEGERWTLLFSESDNKITEPDPE